MGEGVWGGAEEIKKINKVFTWKSNLDKSRLKVVWRDCFQWHENYSESGV